MNILRTPDEWGRVMEPGAQNEFSIDAGGRKIAVRCAGNSAGSPLLLLHGLALSIEDWPPAFIDAFVRAGRRVVMVDNRDAGKSSRWSDRPTPGPVTAALSARLPLLSAFAPEMPYAISDMAGDAVAVLDHLNIARCDVVGVSMGGMIAQRVAIRAPDRVASLTLIMTSSNAPGLPLPDPAVRRAMAKQPKSRDAETLERHMQAIRHLVARPRTEADAAELRVRVSRASRYGHPPESGAKRQLAAILSDAKRWRAIDRIEAPALVIHGDCDPLIPLAHGKDLAARLRRSELLIVKGMGHELLPSNLDAVCAAIRDHAASPEPSGGVVSRPS